MKLAATNADIDGLVAYIMKRAYEHNLSERSDKKDDIVSNEFKAIIRAAIQPCIEKLQRRVAELEGQVGELREAVQWAENELEHELDETGCCQKWCFSCIAIKNNKTWKQWRQKEYNPIRDALIATMPKKE